MMQQTWDADRMGRLELLYREGCSCAVIGREIGVSKNAVVGKAHRMNLPRRRVIVRQLERKPALHPPRRRHRVLMKKPVIIDPDRNYCCSIAQLNNETCRYPFWNSRTPHAERVYCGKPGADLTAGIPYCEHHSRLCGKTYQA